MKKLKKFTFEKVERDYRELNYNELMSILGGTGLDRDCFFACLNAIGHQFNDSDNQEAYEDAYENKYNEDSEDGVSYQNAKSFLSYCFTTASLDKDGQGRYSSSDIINAISNSNSYVMVDIPQSNGDGHAVILYGTDADGNYKYYDPQQGKNGTVTASGMSVIGVATGFHK